MLRDQKSQLIKHGKQLGLFSSFDKHQGLTQFFYSRDTCILYTFFMHTAFYTLPRFFRNIRILMGHVIYGNSIKKHFDQISTYRCRNKSCCYLSCIDIYLLLPVNISCLVIQLCYFV